MRSTSYNYNIHDQSWGEKSVFISKFYLHMLYVCVYY